MDFEFHTYQELESYLQAQLQKGQAYGVLTSYQAALDARDAIAQATEYSAKMGAVARYGAEIKRWHKMLIQHCSHIALKGRTLSRTNVSHWQKAVFGKSMAHSELHMYADKSRSAGDKVPSLTADDPQSIDAGAFFRKHQHLLKAKTSPEKFASTM